MKEVFFFINGLYGGGAERVVSNLTLNLPENIQSTIVLFGKFNSNSYDYKGKLITLDSDIKRTRLDDLILFFKRIKKLNKIKRKKPSVPIISFLELPNMINTFTFNTSNSYVSVRNFMSVKHNKGIKSLFWNLSIKYLYKRAKQIIVVSEQIKSDLVRNYKLPSNKIKVIYNFYNLKEINELSLEKLNEDEENIFKNPTIINVGRLCDQKGQIHLIRSFKKLKQKIPNAQLVFLGEGQLQSKLERTANDLNVHDSVHFLGFQKNPFKYIYNSKVFVLSSYYEGFPNALAEAMACGVPVVSTDCDSGPREILAPSEIEGKINYQEDNGRYGVLVPDPIKEDARKVETNLAEAIVNLLKDKERHSYYSNKSKERIKDFDVNHVIKQWVELIHQV